MSLMAAGVVLAAVSLDRVVGEPPARLHPVAWFGRLIGPLDRSWDAPRLVGAVGAFCLPLLAAWSSLSALGWLATSNRWPVALSPPSFCFQR